MSLNRESLMALLVGVSDKANKATTKVDGGLMVRVRDGLPGHPKSPSFDAGQSTNPPPDDMADELRGKTIHSDPTGTAAMQSAMFGNRARDDAKALIRAAIAADRALTLFLDTAAHYEARTPNLIDQGKAADEPGCLSCARVPGHGGKPWWNPQTRTTTLSSGVKVALCNWCYETPRIGARWTGQLPPVEDVASFRDNGRPRKKSA